MKHDRQSKHDSGARSFVCPSVIDISRSWNTSFTDYTSAARTRRNHSLRCTKRGKTHFKYSNFPTLLFQLFTTVNLGKTKEDTLHDYYALRTFSNLFLGFLLSRLLHYHYGTLSISCSLSRLLHPDGLEETCQLFHPSKLDLSTSS
jgi:hypothetical protein